MRNNEEIILVLVTDQKECERLIQAGYARLAPGERLCVLSVKPCLTARRNRGDYLDAMFALTSRIGAEMIVYYHNDPLETVKQYIETHAVSQILTGVPSPSGTLVQALSEQVEIPITVVDMRGRMIAYRRLRKLA